MIRGVEIMVGGAGRRVGAVVEVGIVGCVFISFLHDSLCVHIRLIVGFTNVFDSFFAERPRPRPLSSRQ